MTTAALTASSHVPPLHYVFHKLDMPEIHERRGNHTTAPCKVPTHPYAFLSDTGRSENRIFHLDSSLHSRLITKYAHLVEMPLMHLETTSSSSVIDCTLQELTKSRRLKPADPRRHETLSQSFDNLIKQFTSFRYILSQLKKEYTGNIASNTLKHQEACYLRSKIQKLLDGAGMHQVIMGQRRENEDYAEQIQEYKVERRLLERQTKIDTVKFLRLMGKMFDKKLQQIQNEDAAVASLRHLGRWNYVLNKLTIASQTSSNPELTELITSLEKDPSQYRCFFLGIDNMDEDQIIDEDLIKMRDRINHHNLSLRTGNVVLLSIQQKIQHLEKHHREIVARIDELEILRELRKRQEDDAV